MSATQYPGNSALPAEVRQRVISTFQQVAQTYLRGNTQEASVGCEFVLRIDPEFAPARQLAAKIRNPETPLDIDALMSSLGAATPSEAGMSPLEAAQAALENRDFRKASELASVVLRDDLTNVEAQRIANEAQERIEAEPFINQFLGSARQKLAAGNRSGARTDFDKAQQLDPQHPALADFRRMLDEHPEGAAGHPAGGFSFGFDSPAEPPPPQAQPDAQPPGAFDFGSSFGGDAPPPADFSFGFSPEAPAPQSPAPPPADAGGFSFGFESDQPSETPTPDMPGFASFDGPPPSSEGAAQGPSGFAPVTPDAEAFTEPPAARGSSEFGFTFEDDQGAPPAAADDSFTGGFGSTVPGEAQTFDFSTASVETTEEDRSKISAILADGDAAFDGGQLQEAIDIWSRIFLIDVTNDAATDRIEKARRLKQEAERGIDGLMTEATFALERGDSSEARSKYEAVLKIDPSNLAARDAIDRLDSGDMSPAAPPSPADDLWAAESGEAAPAPGFEPVTPPPPPSKGRVAATTTAPAKRGVSGLMLAIVAVLLIAGVAGAAWWFLRSDATESVTVDSAAAIQRGERLAAAGDYEGAIAALLTVPNGDPNYGRAAGLLDEYRKLRAQEAGAANRSSGAGYDEQLAAGRAAFAAGDFLRASETLGAAAALQALPPDAAQMLVDANARNERLRDARTLMAQERWGDAAAALQALRTQDPGNANVREMLAASHFNRGVTEIRSSNTANAVAAFDAALAVDPDDEIARRSRDLAAKYDRQDKDLLFQIYVKYLPIRTF